MNLLMNYFIEATRREKTLTGPREKTEAEAVAFVVCHAFGVDTAARSNDYIQLYRGDSSLLVESLDYVRSTAVDIIKRLETKKLISENPD